MIEYIILGFLMRQAMTGYDIKQYMGYSTAYFMDASFGSIYPALKRLTEKGLISLSEVVEGGKLKKVYSITNAGRESFSKWLGSPIEASKNNISGSLTKIFFLSYLPKEQAAALLHGYIRDIDEYRQGLTKLRELVILHANGFELSTLDFGLDYYTFIIDWYSRYLQNL
ncbi:PadR family transcriptional regulator [Acetanaerobacterium elongatum]|uniref:Transcriptional regulator, PadR family n=1 Tax=Acetanaerobacterium elongatum TaxID=258515 RepID=A0A1H0DG06_9FIRM|nr:PadR family transcriptional regulator [Acetanaerobacterium elongatum]SDN68919.1 transcriptional regulator, PadR family [Acetanaerobacterium elongatum]